MPSTTSTTVTIGSILDLIGPTTQTAASSDDQSGFDSLLQATPSPPPSPPSPDPRPSPTADSRPPERSQQPNASEPSASDHTADRSNQDHDSSQSDPAPVNKPPAANSAEGGAESHDPDHSNEKSDDQLATEQVIAQSLAGLPTAPKNAPAPTAPASPDPAATSKESLTSAEGTGAIQTNTGAGQIKPANPDAKTPPTDASTQANTASDEKSQHSLGDQLKSATAAATGESIAQKTPTKAQAADKVDSAKQNDKDQTTAEDSQQDAGIKLTGDEKPQPDPTQTTRHDQSPTADAPQLALNATTANTSTPDVSNSQLTNATSLVVPATNVTPTASQPDVSQTPNSSSATAISNMPPRARLPAQALVPAANASTRHAPVEIDAARLISRVVRAFSAAQERDGEVRLRLSPPELGSLQLDVRVENGALTAHLQTETDSARLAIIDNLPTLRDRLAEQGVRIERFDVDLMQRQPGGMPDQPGGRQPDTPEAPLRLAPPTPSAAATAPIVANPLPSAASTGGLNVVI